VFDSSDQAGDEHVWRLTGHGPLKVRATGVEKVLGLAVRGGQLYALEMSTTAGGPTPIVEGSSSRRTTSPLSQPSTADGISGTRWPDGEPALAF
jgi:hypothetical protein